MCTLNSAMTVQMHYFSCMRLLALTLLESLMGDQKNLGFKRFLTLKMCNKRLVENKNKALESPKANTVIESFKCRGYLYDWVKEAMRKVGE